jgi:hypothetical protein
MRSRNFIIDVSISSKYLFNWSEIEIKAGIYDRQNEIAVLQNELRVRASQPVKPVEEKGSGEPTEKPVEEKVEA